MGPTIGSYGGHWWGNVSDIRYDVFPSGSYSVGDEWRRVSNQVDLGGIQVNYEFWENNESPLCCASGLFCTDPPGSGWYLIEGCNPVTGGPKRFRRDIFTYVPNWFTDYERLKYEFFQWSLLGGFRVSGRLYS